MPAPLNPILIKPVLSYCANSTAPFKEAIFTLLDIKTGNFNPFIPK